MSLMDNEPTFQAVYRAQQLSARTGAGPLEEFEAKVFGILCRVPVLQLAFDPLLPHLPTQRSPSLLLQIIRQSPLGGKKPASMSVIQLWECRAISGKSSFKENCSGCHWGHLGVCVLCSNCFISAEKNLLVTMILQLTVALWKGSISSKNGGVY